MTVRFTSSLALLLFSVPVWGQSEVAVWGAGARGQAAVPAELAPATKIAAGFDHSVALLESGELASWGSDEWEQLDNGGYGSGFVEIDAGRFHTVGLFDNGAALSFGGREQGIGEWLFEGAGDLVDVTATDYSSFGVREDGTVVQWPVYASTLVPEGLSGVVAIDGGADFVVALRDDGTVTSWGSGTSAPRLSDVVAVSAGTYHALALRSDGTVAAWATEGGGPRLPDGLSDVVAISAGGNHGLALRSDGTVVSWGSNAYGQASVPEGLTDVVSISAGRTHSLALRSDGTVVAWGGDPFDLGGVSGRGSDVVDIEVVSDQDGHALVALHVDGTVTGAGDSFYDVHDVPDGLDRVVAISASREIALALRDDGTVAAWGARWHAESPVHGQLTDIVAVSAGIYALALRADGTVVEWGRQGEREVPEGLDDVVAIESGWGASFAVRADGTVAAWGYDTEDRMRPPEGLTDVVSVSAEFGHAVALREDGSVVEWGYPDRATGAPRTATAVSVGDRMAAAVHEAGVVCVWGAAAPEFGVCPQSLSGATAIGVGGELVVAVVGLASTNGERPSTTDLPTAMLFAPAPNPSAGRVSVGYRLSASGPVVLDVLDVTGRRVAVLAGGDRQPGTYTATWNGSGVAAGVYVVRLMAPSGVQVRRVTVAR